MQLVLACFSCMGKIFTDSGINTSKFTYFFMIIMNISLFFNRNINLKWNQLPEKERNLL